ncbi:MAG TPA: type II secretion system F family protein [Verrucomicrobiae bacterium]
MNVEELGFFNRQLAGMLKAGIPLEGSLRKLCETMPASSTRESLLALERDLASGTPLAEAVKKQKLPELYGRILTAGAASGDLPKILILFADFCGQRHSLSRQLRGIMVYPLIVLTVSLAVSIVMTVIGHMIGSGSQSIFGEFYYIRPSSLAGVMGLLLWFTPFIIALVWLGLALLTFVPMVRRKWQWSIPGMRETCLAQIASMVQIQLRSGMTLPAALQTVEALEDGSPVAAELAAWREHLSTGGGTIPEESLKNKSIPPLFRWMVRQCGEDAAEGFEQAAKFYAERSATQREMLLFAALPVSVLILGTVIAGQMLPVLTYVTHALGMLGDGF